MIKNYNEINNQLQGRNKQSRRLTGRSSYLIRDNENIAVCYHNTNVLTITPKNEFILNSGGWRTATTKERINRYMPEGFVLTQDRGNWYIMERHNYDSKAFKFQDGITIKNGKIKHYAKENLDKDKKIKLQVKNYAKLCADNIPLEKPSGGDCWLCLMHDTKTGEAWGESNHDTEHLISHIKEKYIVPSLVLNALKKYGYEKTIIPSLVFNNPEKHMLEIAQRDVKRCVYRYILNQLGYSV